MKTARFLGIDAGAETLKVVEIFHEPSGLRVGRGEIIEHGKAPGPALLKALEQWDWAGAQGAAVSGRFADRVDLPRIPQKQAQLLGFRQLVDEAPATIINIGARGFSVLELRAGGQAVLRENSRCSQGTGNFLRQLVERFSLTVQEAGRICEPVEDPAQLSGRCPVILKTDMTHLANKGETRERILAGLFDAVCENVLSLVKPGVSPCRVLLTGGVSRSPRVRRVLTERLAALGFALLPFDSEQPLYLQAIGCGVLAAERPGPMPRLDKLLLSARPLKLERLPALSDSLPHLRRMPSVPPIKLNGQAHRLVVGLDIGSTGSKAVVLDLDSLDLVWEGYRQTLGEPVAAAQDLLRRFAAARSTDHPIVGFGATGSGREIVGSLLANCFGTAAVFVVNEIVAHAAGARSYDPQVDTIFEIGGQDAKYIRLAEGRVVDCAMNEACSAGTGSFIEEQGRKFANAPGPEQLGRTALAAPAGVSLGQHCSVFMAEVIDEAVAGGVEAPVIISGLYDSIVKNYLNRVKGNRSVGKVIFCQGMPFAADALAAAVARQTDSEVVIPPNPGMVGALGVALLAAQELDRARLVSVDPGRFFEARIEAKDVFVCGANRGCGGVGNCCRIERLRTVVGGRRSIYTWGGACALHDQAARKQKLPDLAPDPFRQREELRQGQLRKVSPQPGRPRIALSDEFMLSGLFPFFSVFLHALGFNLEVIRGATPELLKRGIQSANAPFCAPMQLFHGIAQNLAETGADYVFLPLVRGTPYPAGQRCAVTCPIVQAAPKVVWGTLNTSPADARRTLSPVIDFAEGELASAAFRRSCEGLARQLGAVNGTWRSAWEAGIAAQADAVAACESFGRNALDYCRRRGVAPVVVLGRDYTIHNRLLNANLPAILREQGAIGIPVDCFPAEASVPIFRDMYWGYGQRLLRAAHQVRRMQGVYALYCSNYSCGPDSFNLHFATYIMEGKPFAVIETDGHSGDAGTKTRVEAFLHCAREDQRRGTASPPAAEFESVQFSSANVLRTRSPKDVLGARLLVPFFGPASEVVAAMFRGLGWQAELLPMPDAQALKRGRRHTSGKECLPVPLTLGGLLKRLDTAQAGEHFVYLMPSTDGPCRFGAYNLLNRIVLQRVGWEGRVRIWSPKDTGYFDELPASASLLVFAAIVASDLLYQALLDARPRERRRGEAARLYQRYQDELVKLVESAAARQLSLAAALWSVGSGNLFGIAALLRRAAVLFRSLRLAGDLPTVELAGEIYVRTVAFSNDFLIEKLEDRGLRVYLAPSAEWIAYCGDVQQLQPGRNRLADRLSIGVRQQVERLAFAAFGPALDGWAAPQTRQLAATAAPYLDPALYGEAILTLGGPLYEYRRGRIDGLINVGPLECMPSKIAEAQLQWVARHEGLPSLSLSFNGDPVSLTALDDFAFEVRRRFEHARCANMKPHPGSARGPVQGVGR